MLEALRTYLLSWYSLLVLSIGCSLYLPLQRLRLNRDIAFLGGRAPAVRNGFLGFSFIWGAVKSFQDYTALEFWEWMFRHTGASAKGSYTAESTLVARDITTGQPLTVTVFIMGNIRVIMTADPENIKAILTTQFADYGKGERFHMEWEQFLGDGIFTTDGAQWHDARQLIRPMFVRERVGDLDLFERHVQKMISLVGSGDGRMVRIDELLFRFSLDAATDYLLGKSVGSLENQASDFAAAFNEVQRVQALKSRAGVLRWLIPSKTLNEGLRIVEAFIEPYITQALAMTPSELEQKSSKSDTFVHALARFTRSRKVIRDQIMAILLAGRDTTASSLSWAFFELARNPRVVEKLRSEIVSQLGSSGRAPSYQDIKDMKYLTHVINETLRLYPVVPYNVRNSLVDTTLPRGGGPTGLDPIGIKANTAIGYSTLMMHRRRDLYPPISETFPYDPADWVPERWMTWTPKSWQFIPFNGGPRICIGQNFAMTEMAYVLIRFFQAFDTIRDYGNKPVLKAEIVLTPGEGVKVGFVKSSDGKAGSEKNGC